MLLKKVMLFGALLLSGTLPCRAQIFECKFPGAKLELPNNTQGYTVADFDGDAKPELFALHGSDSSTGFYSIFNADSSGNLVPDPQVEIGIFSSEPVSGDLDGDGDLDVIVSNTQDAMVSVLLNDGSGGFSPPASYPVTPFPLRSILADMDGDLDLDLVVVVNDNIEVLLNDGQGILGPPTTYFLDFAFYIESADFDGDGDQDIVATTNSPRQVVFFVNDGIANLTQQPPMPFNGVAEIEAADYDADGDIDLAVAGRTTPDFSIGVTILSNDGNFTFSESSVNIEDSPSLITAVDYDNDSDLDLIVGTSNPRRVTYLQNNAGTFSIADTWGVGGRVNRMSLADLNCDNDLDLIVGLSDIRVFPGQGNGQFQGIPNFQFDDPRRSAVGDIDGDGDADILVPDWGDQRFHIILNQGNETFERSGTIPFGSLGEEPLLRDMDQDGDLDLVFTDQGFFRRIFTNNGDGTFAFAFSASGQFDHHAVADMDGDGDLDWVTSRLGIVRIFLNQGSLQFSNVPQFSASDTIYGIQIRDIDNDNDMDIVYAYDSGFAVLFNSGGNNFTTEVLYPVSGAFFSDGAVALADIDGDGDLDIATGFFSSNEVNIFLNDGNGAFANAGMPLTVDFNISDVKFADLDMDSDLDLVVIDANGMSSFHNDGLGNFSFSFFNTTVGQFKKLNIADLNNDSALDVVSTKLLSSGSDDAVDLWFNTCREIIISGDVNRDGVVNLLDVEPFINLLSNGTFQPEGDCNEDGVVNLLDVEPFVAILSGG